MLKDNNGKLPENYVKATYPASDYLPGAGIDNSISAGDAFVRESQNAISKKTRK